MDKEMLEALRSLLDERDERLSQMMDTKLTANSQTLREEMSQMMDAKLEPIKADMAGVKADMAGVKADVAGVKADVAGVKADVAEIKREQSETNKRLEKIEGNQEYGLKWTDRIEQRLNPVADYFETMNDLMSRRTLERKK